MEIIKIFDFKQFQNIFFWPRSYLTITFVDQVKKTIFLWNFRVEFFSWWWWLPITLVHVRKGKRGGRWRGSMEEFEGNNMAKVLQLKLACMFFTSKRRFYKLHFQANLHVSWCFEYTICIQNPRMRILILKFDIRGCGYPTIYKECIFYFKTFLSNLFGLVIFLYHFFLFNYFFSYFLYFIPFFHIL